MAEGGVLPWKVQKINESRGPAASFQGLRNPLPKPPNGQAWYRNPETREWSLIQTVSPETTPRPVEVVQGVPIAATAHAEAEVATATATVVLPHAKADFVEHVVLPTDTFQGICLRYKITPTELRRANHFSGSNLLLAPSTLLIPLNHNAASIPPPQLETPEFKIAKVLSTVAGLSRSEAKAYLELNDWDADEAIANARNDIRFAG